MSNDNFYITTPIYYVNDAPHIGTSYTTLLADVIARYHRLVGERTHFLTGTDEHGQKVLESATKRGLTPQAHADAVVTRFYEAWEALDISYDDFIRTTEPRHTEVVKEVLQDLYDRDEIYRGEYTGWYDVRDERFYTEKELVEGKSPDGNPVEKIVEANYFFRMSKYQDWLIKHIEDHPQYIQPDFRRNETLGFLRRPLEDLCISRPKARLPWGVPLPFDEEFVCYVWVDALVNYISAVGYRRDDERFETWWPASVHLIGKDILTTHTVYWPTLLQAMGVAQPRTVFAHGWWLTGGTKMGKSAGNAADPMSMKDKYGVSALRYYLMADMSLGADATFTEESFVQRYNSDLANDLGNLASRVLKMIERNFDGKMPEMGEEQAEDRALRDAALSAAKTMLEKVETLSLDRGIGAVLEAVRAANRYFDHAKPWALAKAGDNDRLASVLYTSAETLRLVSALLHPVIPEKMEQLRRTLGVPESDLVPTHGELSTWGALPAGTALGEVVSLFPRIDRKALEVNSTPPPSTPAVPETSDEGLIDIATFSRVDLRVAVVLEAERVKGADRLLRLKIDLGRETRQIVAGIAVDYTPDAIVGQRVIVVANLEPATIRGVRSQGMLLAAKAGDGLKLVTVDGDAPPGTSVG